MKYNQECHKRYNHCRSYEARLLSSLQLQLPRVRREHVAKNKNPEVTGFNAVENPALSSRKLVYMYIKD